jgi:sugar phosphate permease
MSQPVPSNPAGSQPPPIVAIIEPLERETINRVMWRLMPMLLIGYFCNFLDRVNVGFAALTMNKAIGLSSAAFGFGSGLFFIGYLAFEVPSNLILNKVGARRWIARIMLTWGIVAGMTPSPGTTGASPASVSCSVWPRPGSIRASCFT